jgi:hypothetical protein
MMVVGQITSTLFESLIVVGQVACTVSETMIVVGAGHLYCIRDSHGEGQGTCTASETMMGRGRVPLL